MDPISLEDLALLDTLRRIDSAMPLEGGTDLLPRLIENGLVTRDPEWPRLTDAGVELCKSLQHRVAADTQAEKILQRRANGDGAAEEATLGGVDGDGHADTRNSQVS